MKTAFRLTAAAITLGLLAACATPAPSAPRLAETRAAEITPSSTPKSATTNAPQPQSDEKEVLVRVS